MTIFHDRRLPTSGALTDDLADPGTSAFARVDTADIVNGLIQRSGDPAAGTLVPRFSTEPEGLCPECQHILLNRTPGVYPSIDNPVRAPRNAADDFSLGAGQPQMEIFGDPEFDSGAAEAEWTARTARHREGIWPRPTTVIDRTAVREGFGAGVVRVD